MGRNDLEPGECPKQPETEIPPPTAIDCIYVKKVFNECMNTQADLIEIEFFAPTLVPHTSDAREAQCVSADVTDVQCIVLEDDEDAVQLSYTLEVTARVPINDGGYELGSETINVEKKLLLAGASDEHLEVVCKSLAECNFCVITERDELGNVTEVTCCVRTISVLKTMADVQLLIPTYGFCPVPEECQSICDKFLLRNFYPELNKLNERVISAFILNPN